MNNKKVALASIVFLSLGSNLQARSWASDDVGAGCALAVLAQSVKCISQRFGPSRAQIFHHSLGAAIPMASLVIAAEAIPERAVRAALAGTIAYVSIECALPGFKHQSAQFNSLKIEGGAEKALLKHHADFNF